MNDTQRAVLITAGRMGKSLAVALAMAGCVIAGPAAIPAQRKLAVPQLAIPEPTNRREKRARARENKRLDKRMTKGSRK